MFLNLFDIKKFLVQNNTILPFFSLFLFAILFYDRYVLQKQLNNLCITNVQLQNTLESLNAKCVQLDLSLNNVLQPEKKVLNLSKIFFSENVPHLDVNSVLCLMATVFVVCFVTSCSYHLCVDNNFLNTIAGKLFIDNNSNNLCHLTLNNINYDILTKIDFKESVVSHFIKRSDQSEFCYLSLDNFISLAEKSTSSIESLDPNTMATAAAAIQYFSNRGIG